MKIAIFGVGLIGGSLGLVFKSSIPSATIIGYGRNPENLNLALSRKAIDKIGTSYDELADVDFIFVCTPVGKIAEISRKIREHLKPEAIVTDVGSTKENIVGACEKLLRGVCHFIGGHPMAGSEQNGIEAASEDLFLNTCYILTPTKQTDTEAYQRLHSLVSKTKASVVALEPRSHDRIVASISHLPHIAAAGLVNVATNPDAKEENSLFYAAGGFRDTTRIAASNPEIWIDICIDNRRAINEMLNKYIAELKEFKRAIRFSNRTSLKRKFNTARNNRLKLPTHKKKPDIGYVNINVAVSDKPGIIMEVSLILGKLGINIENLEILHTTGNEGILLLTVENSPNLKKAVKSLQSSGFKAKLDTSELSKISDET